MAGPDPETQPRLDSLPLVTRLRHTFMPGYAPGGVARQG